MPKILCVIAMSTGTAISSSWALEPAVISNGRDEVVVAEWPRFPVVSRDMQDTHKRLRCLSTGDHVLAEIDRPWGPEKWINIRIERGASNLDGYVPAQFLRKPAGAFGDRPFPSLELPDPDRRAAVERSMKILVKRVQSDRFRLQTNQALSMPATTVAEKRKLHEALKSIANKGDRRAQFYVALQYRDGEGIEQAIGTSIRWAKKAALNGHRDAAYWVASVYDLGLHDVAVNSNTAYSYYSMAADQGHPIAAARELELEKLLRDRQKRAEKKSQIMRDEIAREYEYRLWLSRQH